MATTYVDQITGYGETVAYKAPCRVATTANVALSGLLTVDGVVLAADDRVLVKDQTNAVDNGIYIVSTGAWTRARDFDSKRDVTKGTRMTVVAGTLNEGREYWITTANPINVGTDNVTIEESLSSDSGGNAAAAAASAAAAANSVAALPFNFSTTTTDADPGSGNFRLNNASPGSATAAYIDNVDSDGVTATGVLDSWDDSTNTIRGTLTVRSKTDATIRHTYNVTGSVVDGTGYRKLTLAYVGGAGSLTNGMGCWLTFNRAGDAGSGTGDVTGPASSTNNGFARFNGTTGKVIKDSAAVVAIADGGTGQTTAAAAFGALKQAASDTATGVVELATAAEVATGTDTGRVPSVSTMGSHQGIAKAWVNFNASSGSPVIRDSFNVTSITDNGVGDFTVNFTTAMANANYAPAGIGGTAAVMVTIETQSTTACRIVCETRGSTTSDSEFITLIVFGD